MKMKAASLVRIHSVRSSAAVPIHKPRLKGASMSRSEIELMIGVPAFNRKALSFETETDPDSAAGGNLSSPGVHDDARSYLVGALDYFKVEQPVPKTEVTSIAGGRSKCFLTLHCSAARITGALYCSGNPSGS